MLDAVWRWNRWRQQRDKGVHEGERRSRRWVLRLLAESRIFWTCGSVLSFCLSGQVSPQLGPVDAVGASTRVLYCCSLQGAQECSRSD